MHPFSTLGIESSFQRIEKGCIGSKWVKMGVSSNWYKYDATTYEGSKIDAIMSQFSLKQLIQEPTHILNDSLSCIDLIFTSQPDLVMESGVHSSLHQNCHHQLIYVKVNLKVFYPPLYEREIMALSTCKCWSNPTSNWAIFLGKIF